MFTVQGLILLALIGLAIWYFGSYRPKIKEEEQNRAQEKHERARQENLRQQSHLIRTQTNIRMTKWKTHPLYHAVLQFLINHVDSHLTYARTTKLGRNQCDYQRIYCKSNKVYIDDEYSGPHFYYNTAGYDEVPFSVDNPLGALTAALAQALKTLYADVPGVEIKYDFSFPDDGAGHIKINEYFIINLTGVHPKLEQIN